MKLEQKLERLEVRLRPNIAAENELIEALAEQDGIYGAKNELMRQCVIRGFLLLKQKMQSVSGSEDEVGAIDALAQAIVGGEYGYRVIKTYLHARQQVAEAGGATTVAPVAASTNPDPKLAPKVLEAAPVAPQFEQAQAALDAVADAVTVKVEQEPAEDQASSPDQNLSQNADSAEPVESPPAESRPKHDWSAMRKVAGSTGTNGGGKQGSSE